MKIGLFPTLTILSESEPNWDYSVKEVTCGNMGFDNLSNRKSLLLKIIKIPKVKMHYLDYLAIAHHFGQTPGLISVCSAHPLVIEAALRRGLKHQSPILIEATSNQVNQFGGYTGQSPAEFAHFVQDLASQLGIPRQRLILGGDHLGPLPWSNEPAEQAMKKAAELVRAFVRAGYTKIHLDCSMPLGGEQDVSLEQIAKRTTDLVRVAEQEAPDGSLRYVIGSEVPAAGGTKAGDTHLVITTPESTAQTLEAMQHSFRQQGLQSAWERVRALVVQPGVEFGDEGIYEYDPIVTKALSRFIEDIPGIIYEAHSTDYQLPTALRALVEGHFAILKVGPALTFALREAVFALAEMENVLEIAPPSRIRETLEESMLADPTHWKKHYSGTPKHQKFARAYSFSDRIRYYWSIPAVRSAFEQLMKNLEHNPPHLSLLSQYMPQEYEMVRMRKLPIHPRHLILAHIEKVLKEYEFACLTQSSSLDER